MTDATYSPMSQVRLCDYLHKTVVVYAHGKFTKGVLGGIVHEGSTSRGHILTLTVSGKPLLVFSWLTEIKISE